MFGLFSFFRARPTASRRLANYFRPQVDRLEVRDCPTGLLSLNTEVLAGHNVLLSGAVSGPNAAGATVEFHGAVELSTIADANGHFSLITGSASLGTVLATATDTNNDTIDSTTATIAVPLPTVTLEVSYNSETSVTLSGDVTSVDGVYTSVSLFGVIATTTLNPDAFGHFTVTLDASALGEISATATDMWSNVSAEADVFLVSDTPAIVDFAATNGFANVITVSGRVTDASPANRTVTFAGMDGLTGRTAITDSNGNFTITFTRPAGQGGTIEARVIDPWGQPSAPVYTNILGIPNISLNANVMAGHLVQLSGDLVGDDVAGALVEFTGAAVGSTYADAYGHYEFVTSGASLGSVTAIATTLDNRVTDAGTSTIAVATPTVTLDVSYNSETSVTLSGNVTSVDGVYTAVTLTGVIDTTTVYPDATGFFTVTLDASALGDVSATATDTWSNVSDVATLSLVSDLPVIMNFQASNGFANIVTLTGQVVDESPSGRTVTFAGMPGLSGQTATTDANGNFTITFTRPAGASGTVYASVMDPWGQYSIMAFTNILP